MPARPGRAVDYPLVMFRAISSTVAFAALLTAPLAAASVPFPSPAGWSSVPVSPSKDASRTFEQWHIAGDISTVTFLRDASGVYADALAAILKNFADNNIRPTTSKDLPCQGKMAHMVEFATGPDAKKVLINRILVPDSTGLVTITYARSDGSDFDKDVKQAETAFCAASPT